ncbi:aminomethyltransferase [Desulfonema ishimotonii]|uniref:Aminomethyltransferase n=1 Tax=Desulfonema ishimotonii TaxID=45657 RepID=A0A401FVX3_9BACT|nr:2Fe-2S iron-sulfur cluster-binding protein [Desulfonema ishimotonii]GBC61109.1 aminomethyltransferase [Desulfonema ishimotonii]
MKKRKIRRLKDLPTLRIAADKPLTLKMGLRRYRGFKGDTVATALYAHGVRVFSGSLKYRRPRGLYSLDGQCANCLMEINGLPNTNAETTLLRHGMKAGFQNARFGMGAKLRDKMDWAMSAGFQYRRFLRPRFLRPFFLRRIRKATGGGKLPAKPETAAGTAYLHTDVCIMGGGPAGITAALAAAGQGLDVILLEARPWTGGSFDYRTALYDREIPMWLRARELAEMAENRPEIRIFLRASVTGFYADNRITAFQDRDTGAESRLLDIRARSVVTATGCVERPLVFEHNDRPGVMLPGCAHRLANTYGILPGEQAVFSVGHDAGIEAALDLHDLGVGVLAVADCRQDGPSPVLAERLAKENIPLLKGWAASEVRGKKGVEQVVLSRADGSETREFACDLLAASAGLTPVTGPLAMAGFRTAYDAHTGFFLPQNLPEGIYMAGRMTGLEHPLSPEASGHLAGLRAAAHCGADVEKEISAGRETLKSLPGPVRGHDIVSGPCNGRKAFVCFDADVTLRNIEQSCQAGFDTAMLAKRWTGAGTGPGQGGMAGHNLPLLLARYTDQPVREKTPDTVRPPLIPVLLGDLAAGKRTPVRRSPLHPPGAGDKTAFRREDGWEVARAGSAEADVADEARNVHENVGITDLSAAGKFRIFGPDALRALQRVYVGDIAGLGQGRAIWSAMCHENGCVADHGVIAMQGADDYFLTTTPERAGETAAWFYQHTRSEAWDFHMADLTDTLGTLAVAGPRARYLFQQITESNISDAALPLMGYRMMTLKGSLPVRVIRQGDLGEISYEIYLPASYMPAIWELILETGKKQGIRPFGPAARSLLRLEKGEIDLARETEIRTTLTDLGLGGLWNRKKSVTPVGHDALCRAAQREGGMRRVGFRMEEAETGGRQLQDGAIVVDDAIRGHVCLSHYSHAVNAVVGTALMEAPLAEPGTRLALYEHDMHPDQRRYATVVPMPFYDPEGVRIRQ